MDMSGQLHAAAPLPEGKNPDVHCIGSCVGPSCGLDNLGEESVIHDGYRTPQHPAHSLVAILKTLSALRTKRTYRSYTILRGSLLKTTKVSPNTWSL